MSGDVWGTLGVGGGVSSAEEVELSVNCVWGLGGGFEESAEGGGM